MKYSLRGERRARGRRKTMKPLQQRLWQLALSLLCAGCSQPSVTATSSPTPSPTPAISAKGPTPVGLQACTTCHQQEVSDWKQSHHALAMQPARPDTVLGNFNNQTFKHGGVTSRFWRKGEQYWVSTDGPDGKIHDYPVQYTFGIYPLQQYLLPLPGGRLQALSICWDTRPKSQGGQRWYHLYPQERMDSSDILHWTGLYQNWNYMCADCHSTGVNKGYDAATKTFQTTWSEVNVSCESCHGPGSAHLQWARSTPAEQAASPDKGLTRSLGRAGHWSVQTSGHPPLRQGGSHTEAFLETCAPCHSRRSSLTQTPQGDHLWDDYRPTTLEAPNYQADGQVLEEVYEYGAFLQSKMHASGVSCRDCHDSHSLQLKASGDALCLNCHQASRFQASSHTHHPTNSAGARCISCHMPVHTFMGVHQRHDHSFRIPRPDQSVALGVPNACNQCHKDRSAEWAARAVESWFGPKRKGFQSYAPAFVAARQGKPEAGDLLTQIAANPANPAVARATALAELSQYLTEQSLPVVEKSLTDADPSVRLQALQALEPLPMEERWKRAEALLHDERRAVRLQATRLLGSAPESELGSARAQTLKKPLQELESYAQSQADRPETHLQMGVFWTQRGEAGRAEQEYLAALELEPRLVQSTVNLADLYRSLGRESEAEQCLRKGLQVNSASADLHHALGLTLVRRKDMKGALQELQQASRLAPDNAQYGYVLAVALESTGQRDKALATARRLLKTHPYHADTLILGLRLATLGGKREEAQDYAARLQKIAARVPRVREMLNHPL